MKQNTERLLPQVGPMWGQKAGADGGANWGANGNQSLPQREKKDIALEQKSTPETLATSRVSGLFLCLLSTN